MSRAGEVTSGPGFFKFLFSAGGYSNCPVRQRKKSFNSVSLRIVRILILFTTQQDLRLGFVTWFYGMSPHSEIDTHHLSVRSHWHTRSVHNGAQVFQEWYCLSQQLLTASHTPVNLHCTHFRRRTRKPRPRAVESAAAWRQWHRTMALCEPLAVFGEKLFFAWIGSLTQCGCRVATVLPSLPRGNCVDSTLNVYPNVFKEFTQPQCSSSISVLTVLWALFFATY